MRKDCYWRIYSIDKLWCQLAKWYVSHVRDREQPLDAFIMLITIISHRFVIRFFTSEVYLQLPASHSLDLLWKCIIFWGLFLWPFIWIFENVSGFSKKSNDVCSNDYKNSSNLLKIDGAYHTFFYFKLEVGEGQSRFPHWIRQPRPQLQLWCFPQCWLIYLWAAKVR